MYVYRKICQAITYGIARIRRRSHLLGAFRKTGLFVQGSFAKDTYYFREAANRYHVISKARGTRENKKVKEGERERGEEENEIQ